MLGLEIDHDGRASNPWIDIPTATLQAELRRRNNSDVLEKPVCGTKGHHGDYNTSLHVFALVLILVLSTLACSFPLIAKRFPKLPIPHRFLFLSRHFGTGVLIATAFVHLLPTAFVSLTDPCLPAFWNRGYRAMAGLVAMTAVLVVVGIEMFFAAKGAGHSHGGEYGKLPDESGRHGHSSMEHSPLKHRRQESLRRFGPVPIGGEDGSRRLALGKVEGVSEQQRWSTEPSTPKPQPKTRNKTSRDDDSDSGSEADGSGLDLELDDLDPSNPDTIILLPPNHHPPSSSSPAQSIPSLPLTPLQLQRKILLQCLLLEAGILFHSIFIGVALSVTTGPAFAVLLVAIAFHQTFEGLALGSRIATIPATTTTYSLQPWLMALAYGTTTPIGQAIGLAVHKLYDPLSEVGLVMVGMMNAISSGLLLFAGLVELLAEDFLSDASYESLRGRGRVEACGAVVAGAMVMAVVGAWA